MTGSGDKTSGAASSEISNSEDVDFESALLETYSTTSLEQRFPEWDENGVSETRDASEEEIKEIREFRSS